MSVKKKQSGPDERAIVLQFLMRWASDLRAEHNAIALALGEAKAALFPDEERVQELRRERLRVAGAYNFCCRKYHELNCQVGFEQTSMSI